jgi:hypothetical protein
VRVETAHPTQVVSIGQQFLFELYRIVAPQLRPYINCGGFLEVSSAKFEGQLMFFARPTLIVESALTQDEMIVKQVELWSVIEQYLPDLTVASVVVNVYFEPKFL